jgi:inner membrane transporter RhtA
VTDDAAPAAAAARVGPEAGEKEDRVFAIGLVLAACSIVQFGAGFAVTLFDELGAGGTVFLRVAFAAVVLWAIWRPRLRGHATQDLRVAAAFGVVLGGMNWTFYESIDRIPLGVAVTLEFAGPLAVAVAGSRRALDGLWVLLAAAGILLLARPWEGGGDLDGLGVALALLAGAFWAAYILLSARTGRLFPGGTGLALAMAVGALVTLPAGIVQGGSGLLEPHLLAAGAAVALASSVIPYSLELEALRRLPEAVFGVLMSLEPALAALAGLVVLDQALAGADVVAIGLVVVASAGATRLGRRA